MSVGTVKGYISRILTKAGLDNRVPFALIAGLAERLVPEEERKKNGRAAS